MKQILQHIKSGELSLETVPRPALQPGGVRVRTVCSLISAGTEKMLIDLAQKNLIGKAQARPDLVRQVVDKARKEGVFNTFRNVMTKLDRPMPLGYSAAGVIEAVGNDVKEYEIGDRVAIAGAGYANHAEVNYVPKNLTARIPDGVSAEEAAYTTVASIALQGVRIAKPELGDYVAVIGLGLIGLITVQILKANGCQVIGFDLDRSKIERGLESGMDDGCVITASDIQSQADRFTRGRGVDLTIVTASTKSDGPIELAGALTRRKGQVVVVGAVGMNIPRDAYYKKELEVKISMSYGPGRYDAAYEEGGVDYPYNYVRWTEQRNMEAVLHLMAEKKLDVASLTTHRFSFDHALDAYRLIQEVKAPYVGILLEYDVDKTQERSVFVSGKARAPMTGRVGVGFVGAGNYATLHLLPHLKKNQDVTLRGLVTATGLSAASNAKKYGFAFSTTDYEALLEDDETRAVFIATRHGTHAEFTVRALEAGKHVFVEKPMVVSPEQLEQVRTAYQNAGHAPLLMVGLNRRFAPMIAELKAFFDPAEAVQMIYRVNSGHIPTDSWLHEPAEGGGMLVGEMCHFLDVMRFLCDETPSTVYAQKLSLGNVNMADHDNVTIVVGFDGGSVGTLSYNTIGDKSASKERIEVYGGGKAAIIDDFRVIEKVTGGKRERTKALNQDKGQAHQLDRFVRALKKSADSPIPFHELIQVMQMVFAARKSMQLGQVVHLAHHGDPVEIADA